MSGAAPKIVSITTGEAVIDHPQQTSGAINYDTVKLLRDMLTRAEAGVIDCVGIAIANADGSAGTVFSQSDKSYHQMVSGCALLLRRVTDYG